MDFTEEIRKQQLLDKITVIRTITPEVQESAVELISKSLFDEFDGVDVDAIEKSLNTVGSILGDSEVDDIEKAIGHKYFKREGTKGSYKYYYTEADYKAGKSEGKSNEEDKFLSELAKQGDQGESEGEGDSLSSVIRDLFKDVPDEQNDTKSLVIGNNHKEIKIQRSLDRSGGQHTLVYFAPAVSDKKFWNINALVKEIKDSDKKEEKSYKDKSLQDIKSELSKISNFTKLDRNNAEMIIKLVKDYGDQDLNPKNITVRENSNGSLSVMVDGKDWRGRSFYSSKYDQMSQPQ